MVGKKERKASNLRDRIKSIHNFFFITNSLYFSQKWLKLQDVVLMITFLKDRTKTIVLSVIVYGMPLPEIFMNKSWFCDI